MSTMLEKLFVLIWANPRMFRKSDLPVCLHAAHALALEEVRRLEERLVA